MSSIDVERWAEAEDVTDWARSQVQGFLYRDDDAFKNESRAGFHVCRDLRREPGKQDIWQRYASDDEYHEAHQEMLHHLRLYRLRIVVEEYMNPTPKPDTAAEVPA